MLGQLIPCGGGPALPLLKTKQLLGRKPECDLVIPCPTVSGRHCLLELESGWWSVCDLESKNGTAVNGHRCDRRRIVPRDILSVGRQRLVVDYEPTKQPLAHSSAHDAGEDLAFEFLTIEDEGQLSRDVELAPSSTSGSKPVQSITAAHVQQSRASSDLGMLIPCGGGAAIPLRDRELVVGRSRECDICVRFPSVSSRHCKLSYDEGYWIVEDLNSTNGTWVDGARCMMQCLMPESILALDKHRFTIHYSHEGHAAPPVITKLFSQSLLEKAGLADELSGDRLAGHVLPTDKLDHPKKYTLTDADE